MTESRRVDLQDRLMASFSCPSVVRYEHSEEDCYFIGIDVGTNSVRAALITSGGKVLNVATHPVHVFEPEQGYYEQSSENIWQACCSVVNSVHEGVDSEKIKGIGFDATCSMVILDEKFRPLYVSDTEEGGWDIIMWMDHRAAKEADIINSTKHEVLNYVGGKISLEMQLPKMLWIKQHKKHLWERAGCFFDLPDFLTWKATGSTSRSLCSTVCKWTYVCDSNGIQGWNEDFFKQIGLTDLVDKRFTQIGTCVLTPGEPCGEGLSTTSAHQLGLVPGTVVATSIIDAHAGGLGSLACSHQSLRQLKLENKLALICGTSTCHIAFLNDNKIVLGVYFTKKSCFEKIVIKPHEIAKVHEKALFVPGVWGPYFSSVVPGMWCNEGGQSAAGKLIDHLVENHPAYSWIRDDAKERKRHCHEILSEVLEFMKKKSSVSSVSELTANYHLYPDFHGNRSPVADQGLRGMISGLSLSSGVEDMALQYLAALQGLAYSTKHILSSLMDAGFDIKVLHACGGLSKNKLFLQTHADVTGLPVILPDVSEPVLLGSAILAATASKQYKTIQDAMAGMGGTGTLVVPDESLSRYHKKKYEVFLKMLEHQQIYRDIMDEKL